MKRSPWYCCTTQPPVRSGWYEVRGESGPFRVWHWASLGWFLSPATPRMYATRQMRGLVWRGVLR